jgi:hypothetical protein
MYIHTVDNARPIYNFQKCLGGYKEVVVSGSISIQKFLCLLDDSVYFTKIKVPNGEIATRQKSIFY